MKDKREQFKNNVQLLREYLKNPKYKSIIKLCGYLIFILIIILIIQLGSSSSKTYTNNVQKIELTSIQKLESMKDYEYEININENQNITNLKGIKYNNINDFEVTNTKEKYTISDNNIYKKTTNEISNQLLSINLISLFPDNIKNFIKEENLIQEIKYDNNEIKKEYKIFNFNLYENINPEKQINLILYENSNYIYKIEIDATEIMKEINSEITNYNIEINYNHINEISDYKSS